jgi:hypothetical protein
MEAIDDLHRLGCPLANAVRIQGTPIATDDGDRRMLGKPDGYCRRRVLREQVHHPMVHEIDHDGAKAPTSAPRPLVHADGLEGWSGRYRGRTHETQKGGWTGRQLQAGREPGPRLPAQSHADRPQDGDQPGGFAGGWRHEIRQALRENAACAGWLAAHKLPYRELDMNSACAPRKVGQLALVTAMNGRRWHRIAWAARGRCRRCELEPHSVLRNGHLGQVDRTCGW